MLQRLAPSTSLPENSAFPVFKLISYNTPELAMSVLPEFRGKGIGTALLAKLFELLRQRRFSQTSLSVDKRNPAVRLYQRSGYKLMRENEVDYIMVKKLDL